MFTGVNTMFIIGATFRFDKLLQSNTNPITERKIWARRYQDYSAPNCGSVFKVADTRILLLLKGTTIMSASFSRRTVNWILNREKNPRWIYLLIATAIGIHKLLGKDVDLELVKVR